MSGPATVAEMRITLVTEKRLCGVVGTAVALTFLDSMAVNTMVMDGHDFGRIAQRYLSSKKKAADELRDERRRGSGRHFGRPCC